MRIFGLKNSQKPIGLCRLEYGEKYVSIRLYSLPFCTKPKYSIAQIQDFRQ